MGSKSSDNVPFSFLSESFSPLSLSHSLFSVFLNFGRDINDSGLGIGTTAKSFHNSGINVSIVEIDPIIHSFAQHYFGLPQVKGQVVFADGRRFIEDAAKHGEKWDFVVHDVFTGGKVPERLFTREMWKTTKEVLKENGVLVVVGLPFPLVPPPFPSYSLLFASKSTPFVPIYPY